MERVEGSKEEEEEEEESGVMVCLLDTSSNSGYVQHTAAITTIVSASIVQSPHSILHRDTLSLYIIQSLPFYNSKRTVYNRGTGQEFKAHCLQPRNWPGAATVRLPSQQSSQWQKKRLLY